MLNSWIEFCIKNAFIPILSLFGILLIALIVSPFASDWEWLPSDPVPVDAIPDIGENQQLVFTEWMGRSPQDIEDQITYPLTSALLGLPGVQSVRSSSLFGMSSIYIIFDEDVEFYWSRARILEKLNSLPRDLLPTGVSPTLGPDATALGQVFWYTLEGRDEQGEVTGGWDVQELRKIQDYHVKLSLSSVSDVSEVASIGGYVEEYQIDVDPYALDAYDLSLLDVMKAIRESNRDAGAKTLEINRAEYFIRGLGSIDAMEDIGGTVIRVREGVPLLISEIATVQRGPALRRGALDKEGAEVVGGVVVARYGSNPLKVIEAVKQQIVELSVGLPSKTLADGRISTVTVVPFYDRTHLIQETLGTLKEALNLEILVTVLVILLLLSNWRASFLIASMLPCVVLFVFVWMKAFAVDANIVALSGIAIAIGTIVDLGIVLTDSVLQEWRREQEAVQEGIQPRSAIDVVYTGTKSVSLALLTTVATTIISFLPIFWMESAEGKLFRPLAFTKTFALFSALLMVLFVLPTLARWVLVQSNRPSNVQAVKGIGKWGLTLLLGLLGLLVYTGQLGVGVGGGGGVGAGVGVLLLIGMAWLPRDRLGEAMVSRLQTWAGSLWMLWLLTEHWRPVQTLSLGWNLLFVSLVIGVVLGGFGLLRKHYVGILRWCLANTRTFLAIPSVLIAWGILIWLGFAKVIVPIEWCVSLVGLSFQDSVVVEKIQRRLPGLGNEFMPALDEGAFLLMPTSMPHAGMEQNLDVLQQLDQLVYSIPEVTEAVGKLGRVDSALDPAPISMYENLIHYASEYVRDSSGEKGRFQVSPTGDGFLLMDGRVRTADEIRASRLQGLLVPDEKGVPFRNWRDHIRSPEDIWQAIVDATQLLGVTSAPKLQPIETRLVMLQTGMRAPMGIKVFGADLAQMATFSAELEAILKGVSSIRPETVFAERVVGKPYLLLDIDRNAIARHGLRVEGVLQQIEAAIGGVSLGNTIEGRERTPIRVRYPREYRDNPAAIKRLLLSTPLGYSVQLGELVDLRYEQGPQIIKSEDTFLVSYVLFDKREGFSEVDVVEAAQKSIETHIAAGDLTVPKGVTFRFSGSYENQQRAEKRLRLLIPITLCSILLILYLQFRSVATALMVFGGVALAFSGAFALLWLYGQPFFLNVSLWDVSLRSVFQIAPVYLSVAVWVGFVALFGIATDDGVLIATYLDQVFAERKPQSWAEIVEATVEAGEKRITPAILTSVTTIIALLPVLTSTGRGSDILIPMAIPTVGGMLLASVSYFLVPVLYAKWAMRGISKQILEKENNHV